MILYNIKYDGVNGVDKLDCRVHLLMTHESRRDESLTFSSVTLVSASRFVVGRFSPYIYFVCVQSFCYLVGFEFIYFVTSPQ